MESNGVVPGLVFEGYFSTLLYILGTEFDPFHAEFRDEASLEL